MNVNSTPKTRKCMGSRSAEWSTAVPRNATGLTCFFSQARDYLLNEENPMELSSFTLTRSGVLTETEGLADALYIYGCDDALICCYGNAVYVECDREAEP